MEEQFDQTYILELAYKIKTGTINDEELSHYNKWYRSLNKDFIEIPEDYANNLEEIRDRMYTNLMQQVTVEVDVKMFKISAIWWKSAAAAVLLIGSLFFFLDRWEPGILKREASVVSPNIAPGKQSATLTLADGKKIVLSNSLNGKLIEEAGVRITKTEDGELIYEMSDKTPPSRNKTNILSTAKGETYRIRLPDGSLVTLNAASSLTFTTTLNDGKGLRKVGLSGEAYFEIAKDKQHPFIVTTNSQKLEVLGTHFNVNSYAEEGVTKTTLLEGSVKVSGTTGVKVLKPGQQSELSERGMSVKNVEVEDAVAWKNGYFMFNSEPLESIMNRIARWYKAELFYEDPQLKKETFFGRVSRSEHLEKVLNTLEGTDVVKFELKGNVIKIKRKKK
ncbi:FecR domain-containing protein [Sphingobacterium sp. SRCM116780]|uniref:FecR family protein n=1 Tax=Sphingobacterium sp. SRCM116780 TaxID=2907623 RepID=UPI001F227EB1|nr:FecR family protein [Sphingobacterium sp. SRCM116780]UIR55679.1 FecR domain-containing protein [Sphingobacterium sp. SRCM116780]